MCRATWKKVIRVRKILWITALTESMNPSYKKKKKKTYEVHPKQRLTQVYKFSPTQIILDCLEIGEDSIIIHIVSI